MTKSLIERDDKMAEVKFVNERLDDYLKVYNAKPYKGTDVIKV